MGQFSAVLPKTQTQLDKALGETIYMKFIWELKLYNTYIENERATIALLKEVFPNSLVGFIGCCSLLYLIHCV